MPKAIALFIDGTWNSSVAVRKAKEAALARNDLAAYEEAADTNVVKLHDACTLTSADALAWRRSRTTASTAAVPSARADEAAVPQPAGIKKYLVGVGGLSEEPESGRSRRVWEWVQRTVGRPGAALTGGAFGLGLARIIKDAYTFLCENYSDGDQIYLFGFSRGAYAARSLAGFVDRVGFIACQNTTSHRLPHPTNLARTSSRT